jgi:hypothetical protein
VRELRRYATSILRKLTPGDLQIGSGSIRRLYRCDSGGAARSHHNARPENNRLARFNNTLRQRVSRLVRETLSFSKKLAHYVGAIKYFICHYNLTRTAA